MNKLTNLIVLSLVISSVLFSQLACKTNAGTSYSADKITNLAKNINPDCPAAEPGG